MAFFLTIIINVNIFFNILYFLVTEKINFITLFLTLLYIVKQKDKDSV